MGAGPSIKQRAQQTVATRVRKESSSNKPVAAKSTAIVVGGGGGGGGGAGTGSARERTYVKKSSAYEALLLGTPHDALQYPEQGALSFLGYNDLCVVPLLSRVFFEATTGGAGRGSIDKSNRPWVQDLLARLLTQRMPGLLQEVCTAPGQKVLHCGEGMESIFMFK